MDSHPASAAVDLFFEPRRYGSDLEVRRRYVLAQRATTTWIAEPIRLGIEAGLVRPERDPEASAYLLHHTMESVLAILVSPELGEGASSRVIDELAGMIGDFLMLDREDVRPRS